MGWQEVTLGQMFWPLSGLGVIAMGIGSYIRWILPIVREVRQFLEDWNGKPKRPGYDPEPGFPERMKAVEKVVSDLRGDMTTLSAHVAEVSYNTQANGGLSSHDLVIDEFRHLNDRITEVESRIPCPPPGEAAGVTPPPDAP